MAEKSEFIKVLKDEKFGRFLVANKPLKKGTRVFSDVPFVVGPKPDSSAVCLGCHGLWNKMYHCSKCGWPCCNLECEQSSLHSDYECEVFSRESVKFYPVSNIIDPCVQYDCITPLRMLLAKEKNPKRWKEEVDIMEDHSEERKKRSSWELDDVNITKYLRGPCGLERFSEELIQKVCGILEVNSVEIPMHVGPNIRGIYPLFAIMSHNCVPSVSHTIINGGKNGIPKHFVEVWASTDIPKDGRLEICYTQVLQCTLQRRDHLWRSKFFYCDCERCSDPTELGTHMSTIKCNMCDDGFVLPINSLEPESMWNCNKCNYSTTSSTILKVIETVQNEVGKTDSQAYGRDEVDKREQDLNWYGNILHSNHSLLAAVRYILAQRYGRVKDYMLEEMTVPQLKRKINMCKDMLKLLNVISPGQNRLTGMILYELQAPLIILSKIEYKEGLITLNQFNKKMANIAELLYESAEILSREDEISEKGIIGRSAMKYYKELILTL